MARTKKQVKVKEPVRLRFNELKDGRKSIYLDIYYNGRRTYQSLKLYLVPETDVSAQIQNANTLAIANAIKTEKILDLTNKIAGITDRSYKAEYAFHGLDESLSARCGKTGFGICTYLGRSGN